MTYNTSTGTLTNAYYNGASLPSGDILSYVTGLSGGSLEIVNNGPPSWNQSAGGSWTTPAYWTPAGVPSISSTVAFPEFGCDLEHRGHAGRPADGRGAGLLRQRGLQAVGGQQQWHADLEQFSGTPR